MEALRECVGTRNVPFEGYIDHGILIRCCLVRVSPTLGNRFFHSRTNCGEICARLRNALRGKRNVGEIRIWKSVVESVSRRRDKRE